MFLVFCSYPVRKIKQRVSLITKTWRIVPLLAFLLVICTVYMTTMSNWSFNENISCHYVTEKDSLQSAEDMTPPDDSIFFHETSCRGGLSSRQACSVESVARIHPDRHVYVFFNSPVSEMALTRSCLAKLTQLKNVKLARLHTTEYAKGSPLGNMLANKENERSKWPVETTSDFLRYVTMNKYGGVYLDTDMLVVKPLDALGKNWVAREDIENVAVGAFAFSKDGNGHQLVSSILQNFKSNYPPNVWGLTGNGAMQQAIEKLCSETYIFRIRNTSDLICNGFKVYSPSVLYPVHWEKAEMYFKPGVLPAEAEQAFTHHLWNKLTYNLTVQTGSPYDKLTQRYCPTIRELFGDQFGWYRNIDYQQFNVL